MSFSLFKNPFEKLSAENQTRMAESIDSMAEYFIDESKNTILKGVNLISKKLDIVVEHLSDISKSLNILSGVKTGKVNKKDLEAVSKSAIGMGNGMKIIVTAIESFAKLPTDAATNFVITIEKISEAFKKAEGAIKTFSQLGPALMHMALGILSFGLAIIFAAPIYAVAAIATLVIMPVMWAWLTFFKIVLKGFPAKDIEDAGKALMVMAGAIFLFGLSLAVSGFLYVAALKTIPIVMGIILGSILLFNVFLGKDTGKKIQEGAKGLMYMAAAVILFGLALLVAGEIYKNLLSITTVIIFGVILGAAFLFAAVLGNSKFGKGIQEGAKGLMYMAAAIILFGLALLLAIPLYNYIFKQDDAMQGLGLIALVILGAVAVFWLISKVSGNIKKAAIGLMLMALDIVLFGIAIWTFGKLMNDLGDPWETLKLLGAVIGGAGLALFLIGKQAGTIIKGALALLVASIPIFLLSMALSKFKEVGVTYEDLTLLGLAVAGLGTAMFLAGKQAMEIGKGSAVMILAGAALITISYGLQKFKNVGLTWADAGMAAAVIAGLGIEMGIAGIAAIPIGLGAIAMTAAGGALLVISAGLQKFKQVGWTKDDGPMLADSLISLRNGFLGITSGDGFFSSAGKIAAMMATLPFLIAASAAYAIMGGALSSIGGGLKKYKQVNWSDKDSAAFTVSIGALSNAFQVIGKDPKNAPAIRLGASLMPVIAGGITTLFTALKKSDAGKYATPLYLISNGIANLFNVFSSSADVLNNGDKIAQSLSTLLGSVFDTVAKLGAKVNPKSIAAFTSITNDFVLLGKTSTQLESVAKSMERISSAMGVFKHNMNGMDKGILKDTKSLFEAMAIISKSGNTQDLIKKYGDSLKETFIQLAELLKGHSREVTTAVTGAAASNQISMEALGKYLNSTSAAYKPIETVKKEETKAIEQQQLDLQPLLTTMTNIENLLRGGIKVKASQI